MKIVNNSKIYREIDAEPTSIPSHLLISTYRIRALAMVTHSSGMEFPYPLGEYRLHIEEAGNVYYYHLHQDRDDNDEQISRGIVSGGFRDIDELDERIIKGLNLELNGKLKKKLQKSSDKGYVDEEYDLDIDFVGELRNLI